MDVKEGRNFEENPATEHNIPHLLAEPAHHFSVRPTSNTLRCQYH